MARDLGPDVADAAGLVYVYEDDPGLRRVSTRGGVDYVDARGAPVRDERTLERIRRLAIPPAWTDVWICPSPHGHIQATGRDARGRKQYRYHADWRSTRDEAKFERLSAFGRALPRLRRRVDADLARHGLARERVLAATARLLEVTLIRVGNVEYAEHNKSFGLTTLRKRHAHLTDAGAVFEFRGKSGKLHRTRFQDRRLARLLKRCEALPGQRLFQYVAEDGERRQVESADVNGYLRKAMGEAFSAKDFRTWAGTLLAARALVGEPAPAGEADARRAAALCVKAVAGLLGNTPAVCRACYIHPRVFEAFAAGGLAPELAEGGRPSELALLKLLARRRPRRRAATA